MEEREKMMFEKLSPEKHVAAKMILETIKSIKEECKRNEYCISCKFYDEKSKYWNPCCLCMNEGHENPSDLDEYDITERIYK